MRTVIEYIEFTAKAEKIFGRAETDELVSFLADNPKAGRELEHFGGIRKLEWKEFGEHSVYFHPGAKKLPLVAIGVFRRGEKMILEKIMEILIHGKIQGAAER